jgi:hypothetical protein
VGILFQRKILISTTFVGLPSLLLFLLFLGSSSLYWKMKVSENKARGWGFLIGSLIGTQILYLLLHTFFTGISLEKTQLFIHERILLNSPLLYTILLLIPLYIYLRFFHSFGMTGTSEIAPSPALTAGLPRDDNKEKPNLTEGSLSLHPYPIYRTSHINATSKDDGKR